MNAVRIAAWSGPRNISTALLRSWGNRCDTAVTDEPLYAYYLARTGAAHPMRDEIVARYDTDWRSVVSRLQGPVPHGRAVWYVKHITKHVLDEVELDWLDGFRHLFVIREPGQVLASYAAVQDVVDADDIGLRQQVRLFDHVVATTGAVPPVVDAADVLADPETTLRAVCAVLDVPFDPAMLAWAPGPRPTDGIWAPHWYAAVERSTGFQPPPPRTATVPDHLRDLLDECRPLYARLAAHRLTARS